MCISNYKQPLSLHQLIKPLQPLKQQLDEEPKQQNAIKKEAEVALKAIEPAVKAVPSPIIQREEVKQVVAPKPVIMATSHPAVSKKDDQTGKNEIELIDELMSLEKPTAIAAAAQEDQKPSMVAQQDKKENLEDWLDGIL